MGPARSSHNWPRSPSNHGTFALRGGRVFAAAGSFTNTGTLELGPGSTLSASATFTQSGSTLRVGISGPGIGHRELRTRHRRHRRQRRWAPRCRLQFPGRGQRHDLGPRDDKRRAHRHVQRGARRRLAASAERAHPLPRQRRANRTRRRRSQLLVLGRRSGLSLAGGGAAGRRREPQRPLEPRRLCPRSERRHPRPRTGHQQREGFGRRSRNSSSSSIAGPAEPTNPPMSSMSRAAATRWAPGPPPASPKPSATSTPTDGNASPSAPPPPPAPARSSASNSCPIRDAQPGNSTVAHRKMVRS